MNIPSKPEEIRFPETSKEKQTVAVLKEVGSVLQEVYKDRKAYFEVNAAIYSEYYEDEKVLLKDLLFPELSSLYKTEKFRQFKAEPGNFKEKFTKALFAGDYPNLKKALGIIAININERSQAEIPTDTAMEIYSNSNGVAIYFPYSENFGSNFTAYYFDNINNPEWGPLATISYADREADTGPGQRPTRWWDEYGEPHISYKAVIISDDYCNLNATHIVGVGAEPTIVNSGNQTNQVYLVFLGDVKCTQQYDRLISLSKNGGGSELRFIRGDNYLQLNDNGQITNPQNTISVNIKRKDIRNGGNWKTINSIWDSNWEINNFQQIFGIYEEDTENTLTLSGSLTTTLTVPGGVGTVTGQRGYSFTIKSNDAIIRQLNWNRTSFYQYNQGGLNNGCGTRNGWTIYDCNVGVMYTLPTQ